MTITIERVRELLEKATEGPWKFDQEGDQVGTWAVMDGVVCVAPEEFIASRSLMRWPDNARFIAALPKIAALAISEHERAEKAEAELRALRDQVAALQADARRLDFDAEGPLLADLDSGREPSLRAIMVHYYTSHDVPRKAAEKYAQEYVDALLAKETK